jgi:hypothetical protein
MFRETALFTVRNERCARKMDVHTVLPAPAPSSSVASVRKSGDGITFQRSADVTRAVPAGGRGRISKWNRDATPPSPASILPDVAVFGLSILAPTLISAVTSEHTSPGARYNYITVLQFMLLPAPSHSESEVSVNGT